MFRTLQKTIDFLAVHKMTLLGLTGCKNYYYRRFRLLAVTKDDQKHGGARKEHPRQKTF